MISVFTLAKSAASGLLLIIVLDFLWIGTIMGSVYKTGLGHLMQVQDGNLQVIKSAAVATWVCIVLGLLLFAIPRAIERNSVFYGGAYGAAFGFIVYAIYDLTNQAVMKGWPFHVTLLDIAWGTFLCGVTGTVMSYFVVR